MIPTAEVPLTNMHRDSIFEEADLPISYVALGGLGGLRGSKNQWTSNAGFTGSPLVEEDKSFEQMSHNLFNISMDADDNVVAPGLDGGG